MTHSFDKDYWQQHWQQTHGDKPGSMVGNPPNPYLARETAGPAEATVTLIGITADLEAHHPPPLTPPFRRPRDRGPPRRRTPSRPSEGNPA
ncbi:hypothetical protein ABZ749_26875, partial [Micromonospora sp. NPDC047753]